LTMLMVILFAAQLFCARTLAAPLPPAAGRNLHCLMCHSAPSKERPALKIDMDRFNSSIHGKLQCVDCHRDLAGAAFPHPTKLAKVDCAACHSEENLFGAPNVMSRIAYADTAHGRALARSDPEAPRCSTCHGDHYILPPTNPASPVFRANIPATCMSCHSNPEVIRRHPLLKGNPVMFYESSVHGRALKEKGLTVAAVCTDCHGVHNISIAADPRSSVSRPHIPTTCGKCHPGILKSYLTGIHGQAFKKGVKEAPVCTDCHGEHNIRAPSEPGSTVGPQYIVKTCAHCHGNVSFEQRFRLAPSRVSTYLSSYHGIALAYGDITAANCASCHRAHDILPSSDPRSSVNKKNLPATCGRCHPGAGPNFAKGTIHLLPSPTKDRGVYWMRRLYQVFVIGMIAAFAGYIALDLLSRRRKKDATHG